MRLNVNNAPKVAAVLAHWQKTEGEATDYKSLNRLALIHNEADAEYQQSIVGQPESVVRQATQNYAETTGQRMQELKFTAEGRQAAEQYHQQRLRQAELAARSASSVTFAQEGRADGLTLYGKLMDADRFAEAESVLQRGIVTGFIRANEAEPIREEAYTRNERGRMARSINNDPWSMRDYLENHQATGQNEYFPRLSKTELANNLDQARAAISQRQRQTSDQIDQAVLSGQARDEQSIRQLAAPARFSDDELKSYITSLRDVPVDTPEALAAVTKDRSLLTTTLENYDPALDVDDQGYADIKKTIRERLPVAERGPLLSQLQQTREKGRHSSAIITGNIYTQIDYVLSRASGESDAPERQLETWSKASALKSQYAAFRRSHPQATPQESSQWLSEALGDTIRLKAATPWEGR